MESPSLADGGDLYDPGSGEKVSIIDVLDLIAENKTAFNLIYDYRAGRVTMTLQEYLDRPASFVKALEIYDEMNAEREKERQKQQRREHQQLAGRTGRRGRRR